MRYYELQSTPGDKLVWKGHYSAGRRWMLPSVDCPECGIWATGYSLPLVDLSACPQRIELIPQMPVSLARYTQLLEYAQPYAPDAPLGPGQHLGPLVGTSTGRFGPVHCYPSWELVVRADTLARLEAAGLRGLIPVPTRISQRSKSAPPLIELYAPRVAQFIPEGPHKDACPVCGRPPRRAGRTDVLDGSTIPDADVFGATNSLVPIVSERFVEVASALGPSDVIYRERSVQDLRGDSPAAQLH
ncbi:hypothetical protein JGU66_18780 [Myxococcaceae bacterium JPH2]|nr:hypothetical protein [Myxococcaceae bacterium JPH2]